MSAHTTDLRELVAHPNWRWVEGMRVTAPAAVWARVIEGGRYREHITVYGQGPTRDGGGLNEIVAHEQLRPDPDDPATLGCMMALVRELWGITSLSAVLCPDGLWHVGTVETVGQTGRIPCIGPTEFDALAVALMAAPQ